MRRRLVCVAFAFCLANTGFVFGEDSKADRRTVAVTGTAVMRTVPDVITWYIGTTDENKDLLVAKKLSDEKMTKILALKDELGVAIEDLQTGQLSVHKEYNRDRSGNRTDFRGFVVSRSVTMKQRDVKKFDEYVTKLLSAAEMEVSFQFESSRLHELRVDTRLRALAIAKDKADAMTKALGAKLGPVVTIEEHQPRSPYSSGVSNSVFVDSGDALPIDVAAGTFAPGAIEVRVSVNVTFEIE